MKAIRSSKFESQGLSFPLLSQKNEDVDNLWEDVPSSLHDSVSVLGKLGAFPYPILIPRMAKSVLSCCFYHRDQNKANVGNFLSSSRLKPNSEVGWEWFGGGIACLLHRVEYLSVAL